MKKTTLIIAAATVLMAVGCKKDKIDDNKKEDILVETVVLDNSVSEGYTLVEGSTLDISDKVSVTPENAVDLDRIYSSSDEAAATVDAEGVITAIKEGQSTIAVEVGSRGRKAEFTLTVAKKVIAVESVVLDEAVRGGIELELGETFELASKVTVLPENATNKAVTYSSSDEAKITVSNDGVITAVAEGSATITVTADGKDASFEVTVIVPDTNVYITSLSFSQDETEYELAAATEPVDLMAMLSVEPAGYTEGLVFESSDDAVASVDAEGKLTLKKLTEGVVVTVKAASHAEVTANLTVKVWNYAPIRHNRHINENEEPDGNLAWTTIFSEDKLIELGGRNNSVTAMLDEDKAYKDPTPGNKGQILDGAMTVFCFTRPGKSSGGTDLRFNDITDATERKDRIDNYEIYFIIDMKEVHKVDYFDLKHLSYGNGGANDNDMGTRVCGFSEISVGNKLTDDGKDLADAEVVKTDIDFRNGIAGDLSKWTIGATKFTDEPKECRYVKFMIKGTKYYDGKGNNSGNTAQIKEFYLGYHEKVYTE